MPIRAAELQVVVGADTNPVTSAFSKLSGFLSGAAQTALGVFGGNLLQSGMNALANFGQQALQSYADFERLGLSLQSLAAKELMLAGGADTMADALGKAAPRAAELQGWVQKLAIKSPFGQDQIAASLQTLMGYNMSSEAAQRLVEDLVDLTAATGRSPAEMESLARALGQVQAKGKLAGQEMLQLTNAGIGVADVARAMGIPVEDVAKAIEEGKISAEEFIPALMGIIESDFGGAAERQASSWAGLMTTFDDIKNVGLREFFSGTFKAIQPLAQKFIDKFSDPKFMDSLRGMGEGIGKAITPLLKVAGAIAQFGLSSGQAQTAIQDLLKQFGLTGPLDGLRNILSQLQPGLAGFGNFFDAYGPRIKLIVEGTLGRMSTILQGLAAQIVPWVVEQFNKMGAWFQANGPLITKFAGVIGNALVEILRGIAGLWGPISTFLGGVIDGVMAVGTAIMQLATGDWQSAWLTMQQANDSFKQILIQTLEGLANWITTTFLGTTWEQVKTTWKNNWDNLVLIVTTLVGRFREAGAAVVEGIRQGINNAWEGLKKWLSGLINGLLEAAKNAIDARSPSRLFANQVGKPIVEGIALGIQRNRSAPRRAILNAVAPPVIAAGGAAPAGVSMQNNFYVRDSGAMALAMAYVDLLANQRLNASMGSG